VKLYSGTAGDGEIEGVSLDSAYRESKELRERRAYLEKICLVL